MTDLETPNTTWQRWIERACVALDVDPDLVDVTLVHELARDVAHEVDRPLAPVSAYILGIALGRRLAAGEPVDREARRALAAQIPLSNPAEDR